jgi:hypothetical protein
MPKASTYIYLYSVSMYISCSEYKRAKVNLPLSTIGRPAGEEKYSSSHS